MRGKASALVAVLDAPAPEGTIGRYTSALGITKVPEAFVVEPAQRPALRRRVLKRPD